MKPNEAKWSQVIYTIKSTSMRIFSFPSMLVFLQHIKYGSVSRESYYWQRWGSSLYCYQERLPGVLQQYSTAVSSYWTSPAESNSSDDEAVSHGAIYHVREEHNIPAHVTITRHPGELVLPTKTMVKPILQTRLALQGTSVPQKCNKSIERDSCVSIKDLHHTKITCHWKITESWSFIIGKA